MIVFKVEHQAEAMDDKAYTLKLPKILWMNPFCERVKVLKKLLR